MTHANRERQVALVLPWSTRNVILTFFGILFLIILFLTGSSIHGSSIGELYQYSGTPYPDENLLRGQPRRIRSDEWLVTTLYTIGQSRSSPPYALVNDNIADGMNMFSSFVPVRHWSTLFKPFTWSFFLMPLDQAYAFWWWMRPYVLLLMSYLVLMKLTTTRSLSFVGAVFLALSPYFHWWMSTTVIALTCYALATLYCLLRLAYADQHPWLSVLGAIYFGVSSALVLYPPYQMMAVWLLGSVLMGVMFEQRLLPWKKLAVYLTVIFIGTAGILSLYVNDFREEILATVHTAYPGQRTVDGGDFSWMRLLSGVYSIRLLTVDTHQALGDLYPNQSEGAGFFFISIPMLAFLSVIVFKRCRSGNQRPWLLILLSVFMLILLLWMFVGMPRWLSTVLGLQYVPSSRAMYGMGVAQVFWLVGLVSYLGKQQFYSEKSLAFISILLFAFWLSVAIWVTSNYYNLSGGIMLGLLIAVVMTVSSALILSGRQAGLWMLAAFAYLSVRSVNPLYAGFDVVTDSVLTTSLLEIERRYGDAGWVVYDHPILGNYLVAAGVKTYGGTWSYPNLPMMQSFDPNMEHVDAYNRFAHANFSYTNLDEVTIENPSAAQVAIRVNPCNSVFSELGVQYVITAARAMDDSCLEQVADLSYPHEVIRIYRRH